MLEGRGVDLLMLETFYDLEELVAAIDAVRSVSQLPLVALMTFDADGQTLGGVSAARSGRAARHARPRRDRREPQRRSRRRPERARRDAARRARARRAAERRPREPRRLARDLPARDARLLRGVRGAGPRLGAGLIGGCCGTTPAQIDAIRAAVDEDRAPSAPLVVRERELVDAVDDRAAGDRARADARASGEFVVSVQLDPPLGGTTRALLEVGRAS